MASRKLYHLPLSPASRKVRLVLAEKGLDCKLAVEPVWDRREQFLILNPAGEVPVLVEASGAVICDSAAICEYLNEIYREPELIGRSALVRSEVRRLVAWFDRKFATEVSVNIVDQKVLRRFLEGGQPDTMAIRAGSLNLRHHLDYIGYLTQETDYLAGPDYSLADIAAAAHLSCLDYLGDVPWEEFTPASRWYKRIKARPAFATLLADLVPGFPPAKHYARKPKA